MGSANPFPPCTLPACLQWESDCSGLSSPSQFEMLLLGLMLHLVLSFITAFITLTRLKIYFSGCPCSKLHEVMHCIFVFIFTSPASQKNLRLGKRTFSCDSFLQKVFQMSNIQRLFILKSCPVTGQKGNRVRVKLPRQCC